MGGNLTVPTFHLPGPSDTHALGIALGQRAFPGAVLALTGDLGAGKTALVRGLAAGLGAPGPVQSPTFVLLQAHYGGRVPLFHADWYRLGDASEVDALGMFEIAADGVLAIEWADRFVELLPADHLWISFTDAGEGRDVSIGARGPLHRGLEDVRGT